MSREDLDRIRFGMATLMREPSGRKRADVLDTAYELGIRRFDTAPIYGLGRADAELRALVSRVGPSGMEITTKFGRELRPLAVALARVQRPMRAAIRTIPGIRRAARSGSGGVKATALPNAHVVVDRVNRAADFIGVPEFAELLTHEVQWSEGWSQLLKTLSGGDISLRARTVGVSGPATLLRGYSGLEPSDVGVVQSPLFDRAAVSGSQVPVLYAAMSTLLARANEIVDRGAPSLVRESIFRLADGGQLHGQLLAAFLNMNPNAHVVVGTSSGRHLRQLVEAVADTTESESSLNELFAGQYDTGRES